MKHRLIGPLLASAWFLAPAVSFADNPTPPAGHASYTCPMHPEVVQGHPGKCPKCGMKLVPKKKDSSS